MLTRAKTKTKTNPAFYRPELERMLSGDPARLTAALTEPCNVDLLTWNIFASLETHRDGDWLAYRLHVLGGTLLRAPLRLALWTGRDREPLLVPTSASVEHVRQRLRNVHSDEQTLERALDEYRAPLEVAVRIESPDVLVLVDTTLQRANSARPGHDRLAELVDAGIEHARRLGAELAVAVVHAGEQDMTRERKQAIARLRDPEGLAAALPWRHDVPRVALHEVSWQQLVRLWEEERGFLDLGGQPVGAFLDYAERCGLRAG